MSRKLQTTNDTWIMTDSIHHQDKLSLICLHHAGGDGHVFQPWLDFLPPWIRMVTVSLPGRGAHFNKEPYTDLNQLIPDLACRIQPWLNNNYIMFGHSLGALLTFEIARYHQGCNYPQPKHLFLAGRKGPRLTDDEANHLLPDEEFIQVLRDKEGTPEEILDNNELIQLLMPAIRADFQVAETYQYQFKSLLHCPITVFAGIEEEPTQEDFAAWEHETTGPITVKRVPGGHFFVYNDYKLIINSIINSVQT